MRRLDKMTRKVVSIVLLAVLALSAALSGCAPAAQEELVIRYSTDHGSVQASAYGESEVLAPKLEELIPNAKVQVYQGGALYQPIEAMNQLVAGNLEMAGVDSDGAGWDPYCNIWAIPMVLSTVGAHAEYKNTTVAKAMEERMLGKGVRVMGWMLESMVGGAMAPTRYLAPGDFTGKKVRMSATLTQGPLIAALGASPMSISGADFASALQTGVVDCGLSTVGGYNQVRDFAPYYTIFGAGGVFSDFYMVAVSELWYQSLTAETQALLAEGVDYFLDEFYKMQYSEDMLAYQRYGTMDPSQPGMYWASAAEIQAVKDVVGTAIMDNILNQLGEEARPLIEAFVAEGEALVAQYPAGTHPLEQTDIESYRAAVHMT
jgi:TRAP-type C4-dicarboxylate transport system substrate-binding protein